ncbi:hypothetical protein Dda_5587 [Drechslerella dactyloides]|uniref:ABC transporter domain-containing protein n=1 Tax=Drechslerella dactyloides TaxID=74499 RepID=A0AAD6NKD4_DREDA|nr:hypothetical protein Dda_5587 [Drechslerella dactyloides]
MPRDKATAKGKAPAKAASAVEPGRIIVTAQQSRFHVDADLSAASREIDIKDLSISISSRDLLQNAHLRLLEGNRYVLLGRNGTGKSTLLKCIAEQRIPGLPLDLRCLLLSQTSQSHNENPDTTTLDYVLRSDARREQALRDVAFLSKALDDTTTPFAAVHAYRTLNHARLERELARAKLIADRRSGARGWDARKALNKMEEEVLASQVSLAAISDETALPASTIEEETRLAVTLLDELQSYLDATAASQSAVRARGILRGLRFTDDRIDGLFSALSGGWRTRALLAAALFQKTDVLMLDEPTNYLDLPSIIWLEHYLSDALDPATTLVVVTHDRAFADHVGSDLLVLREQKLEPFEGTQTAWEVERWKQIRRMTRMKEAQDKKVAHMEKTIEGNAAAARRSGDDKKLKQAASRRKKLEERTGLEVGLKGGRFKLNRDLGGYHLTARAEIEIPTMDKTAVVKFPLEPPDLRFPGSLVALENVSYRYPGSRTDALTGVNLTIHPGARVGLCGLNGSGKSTVVKLAIGEMKPTTGTVTPHPRLKVAYFSQHVVEELEALSLADKELTALRYLMSQAPELSEQEARGVLGGLGLQGRITSDVPLGSLSGGQRSRVAMACLLYTPPHLLILDEVTTHLDGDTIVSLVDTLKEFRGAVLVVTHDRFFMRCVVEGESAHDDGGGEDSDDEEVDGRRGDAAGYTAPKGQVYRVSKGVVTVMERGMAQYEEIAERSSKKLLEFNLGGS